MSLVALDKIADALERIAGTNGNAPIDVTLTRIADRLEHIIELLDPVEATLYRIGKALDRIEDSASRREIGARDDPNPTGSLRPPSS